MMEHVCHTSSHVYDVDELCPMQHWIFVTLLVKKFHQVLFVDQIAGGKYYVMRLLGTVLKGTHLYFFPLLELMADAIAKFQQDNDRYGQIIIVNLDELGGITISAKRILTLLCDMKSSTSATVFLVSSPPFMVNNNAFINILLHHCRLKCTLQLVMINKVHV